MRDSEDPTMAAIKGSPFCAALCFFLLIIQMVASLGFYTLTGEAVSGLILGNNPQLAVVVMISISLIGMLAIPKLVAIVAIHWNRVYLLKLRMRLFDSLALSKRADKKFQERVIRVVESANSWETRGYLATTINWASTRIWGISALLVILRWSVLASFLIIAGVLLNNVLTRVQREGESDPAEVIAHYKADLATISNETSASEIRIHGYRGSILKIVEQEQETLAACRDKRIKKWLVTELIMSIPVIVASIVSLCILVYSLLQDSSQAPALAALPAFSQLHNLGVLFGAIRVNKAHKQLYKDLTCLERDLVSIQEPYSGHAGKDNKNTKNTKDTNRDNHISSAYGNYNNYDSNATDEMVKVEDVSFAYPGQDPGTLALKKVSFTVKSGQLVALVGANGAGKSTLLSLLSGIVTASDGKVQVLVPSLVEMAQTPSIMPFSIAENIWPWRGDHPGNLRECNICRGLGIDRFAGQEDASQSSGGEKQRMALARCLHAVSRNPGLLVLDEPSSALDVAGEAQVVSLLKEHLQNSKETSVIFSSHRFSTVKHADLILVLEQGRLIEQGTHQSLMESGGVYAAMYTSQAEIFGSMKTDD